MGLGWGLAWLGLLAGPASGGADLHARPAVVCERLAAEPGETVWVAVDFELDEGWHTYWPGANDTGLALDVQVECSANAEPGDLVWPAPHRLESPGGLLDHVFEGRMTVLLPVAVSPEASYGDAVTVSLDMRWLVCKRACVMESAERSLTIPIERAAGKVSREVSGVFERARARLPGALKAGGPVRVSLEGGRLEVWAEGAEAVAFYPLADSREARDLLKEGRAEGGRLSVVFREGEQPIGGVLEVWSSPKESKVYAVGWPEPSGGGETREPAPTEGGSRE